MYRVFRQEKPIRTGEKFQTKDDKGNVRSDEWHLPNLVEVGRASSFAEAKELTPYPIMEAA